mmetsp:Transcript_28460/g.59419  ORF Transcript_28460/g.59419 Transcript_28460/m.59419 type:complete len:87 (+) Transcript_28460:637-897(+)
MPYQSRELPSQPIPKFVACLEHWRSSILETVGSARAFVSSFDLWYSWWLEKKKLRRQRKIWNIRVLVFSFDDWRFFSRSKSKNQTK